jgi:alkanesulfonate monooxygenase SsuD/methylene tetrahydromethanopterin reductase-like flavin-dependent oxidoreductase (luciferase family)
VLARHCADVGRDPSDVRKSITFRAILAEDEQAAQDRSTELFGGPPPERFRDMYIVGTPEQCVERLREYAALGVGDFLLGAMAPVDWQTIELIAESVAPAVRDAVAA